jgi:hypothetical protein
MYRSLSTIWQIFPKGIWKVHKNFMWETIKVSFSLRQGGFAGGKGVPEDRGTPNDRDCKRQMACIGHLKYFSEETLGTPQEFSWILEKEMLISLTGPL